MKATAASKGMTLRDWAIAQFRVGILPDYFPPELRAEYKADAEFLEGKNWHDPKTCRVYRCAQCISLGKKF